MLIETTSQLPRQAAAHEATRRRGGIRGPPGQNYPNLIIAALDRPIARRTAELRAEYRLRPADALHVAAWLEQGATAFLSNDRELRRITHLHVWMLEDFV